MRHYYQSKTETKKLAIGIKGHLSSLCGAIKRFERKGTSWNGFLSLKEQCARRIVRLKNEQLKCFIMAYLPPNLFNYVTKDIFNLRRAELISNRAKYLRLCDECTMDDSKESPNGCRCPNLDGAIDKLNKYFFKRRNKKRTTNTNQFKQLELIYRVPYDEDYNWQHERPLFYFMYLAPCEYDKWIDYDITDDMDSIAYQSHRAINSQVSVEDKLLFVDIMRIFGGFHSEHEQPQLILSERCDIDR
jgi:hypothetical protein